MTSPSISTSAPGSPKVTVTLTRGTSPAARDAIQKSVQAALRDISSPNTQAVVRATDAIVKVAQPSATVALKDPVAEAAKCAGVRPDFGPTGVVSSVISYIFGWTYREPVDRRLEKVVTSLPVRKENVPLSKIATDFNALFKELQPLIRSAMMARDVSLWYQVQPNEDPEVFRVAYDAAAKAQSVIRKGYTEDLVKRIAAMQTAIRAEYARASAARYTGTDEAKRLSEESYTCCRIYGELLTSLAGKLDTRYGELSKVKIFSENLTPVRKDPLGEASQAKLIGDLMALYDETLTTKEWYEVFVGVFRSLPYYENRTFFVTPITDIVTQQYGPLTKNVDAQRTSVDLAIKALLQIPKDSEAKARAVDGQLAILKTLSERIASRYSGGGWVNSWAITQAYEEIVKTARWMQDQFPKS